MATKKPVGRGARTEASGAAARGRGKPRFRSHVGGLAVVWALVVVERLKGAKNISDACRRLAEAGVNPRFADESGSKAFVTDGQLRHWFNDAEKLRKADVRGKPALADRQRQFHANAHHRLSVEILRTTF